MFLSLILLRLFVCINFYFILFCNVTRIFLTKVTQREQLCSLGMQNYYDCVSNKDIKCRLSRARKGLVKKNDFLTSNIDLNVRKSFLKEFTVSVALRRSEIRAIS